LVRKQPSFGGGPATAAATAARRSTGHGHAHGHPPRKRHRNGVIHKGGERMRFVHSDGTIGRSGSSYCGRKRPLVLNNNNISSTTGNNISTVAGNASQQQQHTKRHFIFEHDPQWTLFVRSQFGWKREIYRKRIRLQFGSIRVRLGGNIDDHQQRN